MTVSLIRRLNEGEVFCCIFGENIAVHGVGMSF